MNIAEVGIASKEKRESNSQHGYDALFEDYKKNIFGKRTRYVSNRILLKLMK